ncbi:MAG: AEC family transporter [Clostridia bacterium]|nr:AEC family transporter [Clostridia bacterium]
MDVIIKVLELLILMAMGFGAVKAKWVDDGGIKGLNSLVVNFSLPCLLIASLQRRLTPELTANLVQTFLWAAISMLAFCALGWFVLFRKEQRIMRALLTNQLMFSNAAFMGFPILVAAFGEEAMIYGAVYVGVFNLLNWSVSMMLYDKAYMNLKKLLTIPAMIAVIIGFALFVCQIFLPEFLQDALSMMGNTTTPLAMFIIGARLTKTRLADLKDTRLLTICALRLVVLAAALWAVLKLADVPDMVRSVLVLVTAQPTASVLTIQAESVGADSALSSKLAAVSTLLSVVTIPLMMLLIG